ncbi:MAG TPA: hypothetical protein VGF14_04395 [Alphaproteobacteria bacterium]
MKNWILLTAIIALVVTGSSVFVIAQRMHHAETQLFAMNREIKQERENLRVLQAEWTYLNNPDRLEKLATTLFQLQPIDGKQYVALANMPTTEQMEQIELANAKTEMKNIPAMELSANVALASTPAPMAVAMPAAVNVNMVVGGQ